MKNLIVVLFLCLPLWMQAQNIEYDKKTKFVSVDGVNCFKIVQSRYTDPDFHTDIFDLEGNKVIRINYLTYTTLTEKGTYEEFIFFDSKQKAEIDGVGYLIKQVAKFVVSSKFFVDGKINPKAVDEFVFVHGTPYRDKGK